MNELISKIEELKELVIENNMDQILSPEQWNMIMDLADEFDI